MEFTMTQFMLITGWFLVAMLFANLVVFIQDTWKAKVISWSVDAPGFIFVAALLAWILFAMKGMG